MMEKALQFYSAVSPASKEVSQHLLSHQPLLHVIISPSTSKAETEESTLSRVV